MSLLKYIQGTYQVGIGYKIRTLNLESPEAISRNSPTPLQSTEYAHLK